MGTELRLASATDEIVLLPGDLADLGAILCTEYDLGTPDPREVAQDLTGASGDQDDTYLHGPRWFTCTLRLRGAQRFVLLDRIQDMLVPSNRPTLTVAREHWETERQATVRPTPWAGVFNRGSATFLEGSLKLKIPAGVYESAEEYEYSVRPPLSTGGKTYDITYDRDYGTGSGGTVEVTALGNTRIPVRVAIYGRQVNPSVSHADIGWTFKLAGLDIPQGSYVVVDSSARTVLLNGSASVYNYVDWSVSSWPYLAAGINRLSATADTFDASAETFVRFRDRWS